MRLYPFGHLAITFRDMSTAGIAVHPSHDAPVPTTDRPPSRERRAVRRHAFGASRISRSRLLEVFLV